MIYSRLSLKTSGGAGISTAFSFVAFSAWAIATFALVSILGHTSSTGIATRLLSASGSVSVIQGTLGSRNNILASPWITAVERVESVSGRWVAFFQSSSLDDTISTSEVAVKSTRIGLSCSWDESSSLSRERADVFEQIGGNARLSG